MDESLSETQRALEFLDSNRLTQLISNSTRQSQTSTSLLDVIVTSTPEIFQRTGVLQNSLSDHCPIYGVVPGLLRRHQHRVITSRRWNEEKVDSFQTDTKKIPWSDLNTPENIDKKLENWLQFFTSNLNKHFPLRKKRIRQKTHPWLDSTILRSSSFR